MPRGMITADAAQRAFAFANVQGAYIEQQVYAIRYRDIQYPSLVPVDTSAPQWTQTVIYYTSDVVGEAKWISGRADDIPRADTVREKFSTTVSMAGIGYGWDLEELGYAQMVGVNLTADKAAAARRAAEEFIDRTAIFGDSAKNLQGLANAGAVTAGSAAATGTGSATTFASKTPDNIMADFNSALTGLFTGTLGAELADTILLPYAQLMDLATRRIDSTNQTTILEWLKRANVYTMQTQQPIDIRGVWGLETAGASSTARMIAYRKSPEVLKMHMPMPFQFLPGWQAGPMRWEVPGAFRLGGVDVRRPKAMRYMDGI